MSKAYVPFLIVMATVFFITALSRVHRLQMLLALIFLRLLLRPFCHMAFERAVFKTYCICGYHWFYWYGSHYPPKHNDEYWLSLGAGCGSLHGGLYYCHAAGASTELTPMAVLSLQTGIHFNAPAFCRAFYA